MSNTNIKAPYNFVPLNNTVVIPHWGNCVSHDIPFKDGMSGKITFNIKAESPIFIKNGVKKQSLTKDELKRWNQKVIHEFSNLTHKGEKKYFIPSTSTKGMIRNIMEIMTYGKMSDRVNDNRYAIRDLNNADVYTRHFQDLKDIHCGWLQKVGGKYIIQDCGNPGRISISEVSEKLYLNNFKNYVKEFPTVKKFKYKKESNNKKVYNIAENGDHKGTIVFTGPISKKKYEFIFLDDGSDNTLEVSPSVIDDFFFAYFKDEPKMKKSEAWTQWYPELKKGNKIPVFFMKSGIVVKHLGLSYLYKLPFKQSVKQSILRHQTQQGSDFADIIFGNTNGPEPLKGRVHVGHAFLTNPDKAKELNAVEEVLSSPRASFYPNYIRQDVKNNGTIKGNYKTFMDYNARISGWKRYPIHSSNTPEKTKKINIKSKDVFTRFKPLDKHIEFSCSIQFHNLREIELGALLSAITFHGNLDSTYHNMGMGKALGFGKVSIQELDLDVFDYTEGSYVPEDKERLQARFAAYMDYSLSKAIGQENQTGTWYQSQQIKELLAMATPQVANQSSTRAKLEYMELKDHRAAKGNPKKALDYYSNLTAYKTSSNPIKNISLDIKDIEEEIMKIRKTKPYVYRVEDIKQEKEWEILQALELKKAELLDQLDDLKGFLPAEEKDKKSNRAKYGNKGNNSRDNKRRNDRDKYRDEREDRSFFNKYQRADDAPKEEKKVTFNPSIKVNADEIKSHIDDVSSGGKIEAVLKARNKAEIILEGYEHSLTVNMVGLKNAKRRGDIIEIGDHIIVQISQFKDGIIKEVKCLKKK